MSQHIDAAAGADPYVCFKAVEEAKQLEKDEKNMNSFKRISVSLKRVRRRKGGSALLATTNAASASVSAAAIPSSFALHRNIPNIPPPRNLIPQDWEEGSKFSAGRQGLAVAAAAAAAAASAADV